MRTDTKLLIGTSLVLLTSAVGHSQALAPTGLESEKRSERVSTYLQELEDRKFRVQKLIAIAKTAKNNQDPESGPYMAITMLGKLRAVEAIPVLAANLTILPARGRVDSSRLLPREENYPAVRALIQIGIPSDVTVTMFQAIESSQISRERELAIYVLQGIYGRDEAISTLTKYESQMPEKRKRAFQAAIEYLKGYKAITGYPTD